MKEITSSLENEIYATFQLDIAQGHLVVLPFDYHYFEEAAHLISSLPDVPLRTLDALHLTVMQHHHVQTLATADQIMALAAQQLDFHIRRF
jgi:predicted nucleic acid-binding protein